MKGQKMKIKCTSCEYLEQIGRMQTQRGIIGRKKYYCKKEKRGYPYDNFVCFGEMGYASKPTIKTTPRWCPRKESEE